MRQFTVLLLYPDYLAQTYGHETNLEWVDAKTPIEAIMKAQKIAAKRNKQYESKSSDWFPLACFPGALPDLKT